MINVTICPTLNWHQNGQKRHTSREKCYKMSDSQLTPKWTKASYCSLWFLRGQNTEASRDDLCHAIHQLYILYGKSGICRSLIVNFWYLKYWRWSLFMQGLCGIIFIAHKFAHRFVCLCPIKMKETVDVIPYKDLFRFVMTSDHRSLLQLRFL